MPSITLWNRIEPRCRATGLDPGLEARVHDPLWLLARQWQVGEFAGRDTGSPVSVEIQSTSSALDRFAIGTGTAEAYDGRVPLEALIERETVRPNKAAADVRQAAEAGLHFLRLLDSAKLSALRPAYLKQYPLAAQASPDPDAQNFSAIVAGRVIDGVKLYTDLVQEGSQLPTTPAIADANRAAVLTVTRTWMTWYASLFSEPAGADAWWPDRMEYQFAAGTAANTGSFQAREYDGGAVDWYTFDRSSTALTLAASSARPVKSTRRALVSPVTFRGMPARRFWELEDASVDIGALSAGAEDLGRLLLREFALIYGNDWFQVPFVVPVGSGVSIDSLVVSDTFGLTTPIPHYTQADGGFGRWRMFAVSEPVAANTFATAAAVAPVPRLIVVPGAVGSLDSVPIEDVLLLRDELANMTWGVERTVVGPSGLALDRTQAWRTSLPTVAPPAADALSKYRLGSTVPDYWIPFLPVLPAADLTNGQLKMRRGILPTSSSGGPLGRMLAYPGLSMFLEEVPREGVHLQRRYRYARGVDGSTSVWVGRRRLTGRGEGRSGLRFDYLEF